MDLARHWAPRELQNLYDHVRMNCPVCNVPLIVVEREGIEVDYCISCRGIWFDAGEIELLAEKLGCTLSLDRVGTGREHAVSERPRVCPRCDRQMEKIDVQGSRPVILDRCTNGHGLWFDAGEVGAVLQRSDEAEGHAAPIMSFLGEVVSARRG